MIRPRRTASHDTLANSPVFWIGLLAGVGVVSVLPTVIAVFRCVGTSRCGVLELSLDCLASRACRCLHDAEEK